MYLLNLSFLQFAAVFGSIAAMAVALYLLDRSRRKQVVSTLRFWVAAEQPAAAAKRKHINQPWSLVLQLAGIALLLLAIAQLRFGSPAQAARNHVIILDTSSWMAARSGSRTLMDLARERARRYLAALPARDRVMLVRADAMATPATTFEPDHRKVEAAVQASQPGATALNLDQALAFARHAQAQGGGPAGEVVFIGTGRTAEPDASAPPPPHNLRVVMVPDAVENTGIRKIGLRRSTTSPGLWEIYISTHNYGAKLHEVTLSLDFGPPGPAGRVPAGSQELALSPGADKDATFAYRTTAAGVIGVTLTPHDAFPADDHAELEIPAQPTLTVTVYSTEPDLLRPILGTMPHLNVLYRKPEEYRPNDRGLVIVDRFIPPHRPAADAIWIDPPAQGSPIPVRKTIEQAAFQGWDAGQPATAGLRAKDFKLEKATVFEPAPGDGRIGEVEGGPVILARDGNPKTVVFGFHPALSVMRYELATPLLFANLLRWISPEIFRRSEITGGSAGTVKFAVDDDIRQQDVRVTADDGSPIPFTVRDRALHFFAGTPGNVHVVAGDREYLYSVTLPQLWDARWEPPADALKGIPRASPAAGASTDVWPWLALAGAAALLAEWILYGRFRRSRLGTPLLLRRNRAVEASR